MALKHSALYLRLSGAFHSRASEPTSDPPLLKNRKLFGGLCLSALGWLHLIGQTHWHKKKIILEICKLHQTLPLHEFGLGLFGLHDCSLGSLPKHHTLLLLMPVSLVLVWMVLRTALISAQAVDMFFAEPSFGSHLLIPSFSRQHHLLTIILSWFFFPFVDEFCATSRLLALL